MKKLIILPLLISFIAVAVFFLSFSSYSEDDGCVVLLNSFKKGIVFEDIVFLQSDNAGKCNKNNTLVLYTLEGSDALKFVEPVKVKLGKVSFFVSSIVPEKRSDDLPVVQGEQRESVPSASPDANQTHLRTPQPDSGSDFVVYYLYNDPDSSPEELDDAFRSVQERPVDLIMTGHFNAPQGSMIRPQLKLFDSAGKPEAAVIVFSVIRLESGEKKVLIRSFNRRFM
ncbi:hypothetical protein J6Y50_05820 [bacterium]|nr:hypothetical protein [bacterium]